MAMSICHSFRSGAETSEMPGGRRPWIWKGWIVRRWAVLVDLVADVYTLTSSFCRRLLLIAAMAAVFIREVCSAVSLLSRIRCR